jgi:hypothetical protein
LRICSEMCTSTESPSITEYSFVISGYFSDLWHPEWAHL